MVFSPGPDIKSAGARRGTAPVGIGVSSITSADLSRYYDSCVCWTRFNKGSDGARGEHHPSLAHQTDSGDDPTTIHKIMRSLGIGDGAPVDALDAGCGYGGTMFALHAGLGRWHGITISPRQFNVGRDFARQEAAFASAVTFARGSYDELQTPRTYSLIYGMRIHSVDPARTIGNLARALRPSGTFVIVDDMPADRIPARWATHLERFKALWRCPVMPSMQQWSAHLAAAGCDVVEVRDLSALMRPDPRSRSARATEEVGAPGRWRTAWGCEASARPRNRGCCSKSASRGVIAYTLIRAQKRH